MRNVTFEDIHKIGHVINENEIYQQYHYPEMLSRYDSNFIQFKRMPTLVAFKEIEHALRDFHQKHNQYHLKFIFPANEMISAEIKTYLTAENYDIGFLELYAIEPSHFTITTHPKVFVEQVTYENLNAFLKLQYDEDLKNGEAFANEKQDLLRRLIHENHHHQLLAYYDGIPAGFTELIEKANTVEIDNLFVLEAFQRKGIGSQIQQYVMKEYLNKTVILVADGEDTPREMYKKQNYLYQGFQYEVLKTKTLHGDE